MKMSLQQRKSGGASPSHRAQGNLGTESKSRGVSEPPAASGLNPEDQTVFVSQLSGVPSLSPGGNGQVMLPGAPSAASGLNPEDQTVYVSQRSGVPRLSPGGKGQVLLPGSSSSSQVIAERLQQKVSKYLCVAFCCIFLKFLNF